MADAAAVQAPAADAATPPAPPPVNGARGGPSRAAGRAVAMQRLSASVQAEATATAAATAEAPKPASAPAPAAPKPAEPEKPDPATDRGLKAIEQAKKKWLDEQAASKAELDVQRAEIARLRKDAEGRVASKDELKKLKPSELLETLEHYSEDDFDALMRGAGARTKAAKTDPRYAAAAEDVARREKERGAASAAATELAAVKQELAELRGEFTKRDAAASTDRWLDEGLKTVPTDKPSFLGKLMTNKPDVARQSYLDVAKQMQQANDGEAPTHAEVVAEFEKRARDIFATMGFDADAILAPPAPKAPGAAPKPAPAPTRTLDVRTPNLTRPEVAPKTREERREVAHANLKARMRTTADQQ